MGVYTDVERGDGMNTNLLNIIRQIIAHYGEDVLSSPQRLRAFFAEVAQDEPKSQKNAFLKCLELNFAQTLQDVSETEQGACLHDLARKLHEYEGLDLALCEESLNLLAAVLFGDCFTAVQKRQKRELQET